MKLAATATESTTSHSSSSHPDEAPTATTIRPNSEWLASARPASTAVRRRSRAHRSSHMYRNDCAGNRHSSSAPTPTACHDRSPE